jgi:hypothetical protein
MPRQLLIQTLDTGWVDRDFILLHACFQCLTDCVEQEKLLNGHVSWDHDDTVREVHRELTTLYEWWKRRAVALAEKTRVIDALYSDDYATDNEMLIRLIKVRSYLWT